MKIFTIFTTALSLISTPSFAALIPHPHPIEKVVRVDVTVKDELLNKIDDNDDNTDKNVEPKKDIVPTVQQPENGSITSTKPDYPSYPANVLSDLNAIAGILYEKKGTEGDAEK